VTGYRPHPLAHLQVGFERGDDFFSDPLEDCPKQGDQSGLPFGQGGIVEGYGDGNFALHLHFRVWPGSLQSHPDEFCAVHRAVRKPFFVREASRVLDDDESKSTRLKLSCLPRDSCIEYPVLVGVREDAKVTQGVRSKGTVVSWIPLYGWNVSTSAWCFEERSLIIF
jgi:hypothetical protein